MQRITAYSHPSSAGMFWITLGLDGQWHAIWDGEDLGGYRTPQEAATHLARGSVARPGSCGDTSRLELSIHLVDWLDHGSATERYRIAEHHTASA